MLATYTFHSLTPSPNLVFDVHPLPWLKEAMFFIRTRGTEYSPGPVRGCCLTGHNRYKSDRGSPHQLHFPGGRGARWKAVDTLHEPPVPLACKVRPELRQRLLRVPHHHPWHPLFLCSLYLIKQQQKASEADWPYLLLQSTDLVTTADYKCWPLQREGEVEEKVRTIITHTSQWITMKPPFDVDFKFKLFNSSRFNWAQWKYLESYGEHMAPFCKRRFKT